MALALCLGAGCAHRAKPASVTLHVVDATGAPVPEAIVRNVHDEDRRQVDEDATRTDSALYLPDGTTIPLAKGTQVTYDLSAPGHEATRVQMTLHKGVNRADVVLPDFDPMPPKQDLDPEALVAQREELLAAAEPAAEGLIGLAEQLLACRCAPEATRETIRLAVGRAESERLEGPAFVALRSKAHELATLEAWDRWVRWDADSPLDRSKLADQVATLAVEGAAYAAAAEADNEGLLNKIAWSARTKTPLPAPALQASAASHESAGPRVQMPSIQWPRIQGRFEPRPVTFRVVADGRPLTTARVVFDGEDDPHLVNTQQGDYTTAEVYFPDGTELQFTPGTEIGFSIIALGYQSVVGSYLVEKRDNVLVFEMERSNWTDDGVGSILEGRGPARRPEAIDAFTASKAEHIEWLLTSPVRAPDQMLELAEQYIERGDYEQALFWVATSSRSLGDVHGPAFVDLKMMQLSMTTRMLTRMWEQAQQDFNRAPSQETGRREEDLRQATQHYAREWINYAGAAGRRTPGWATEVCTVASGRAEDPTCELVTDAPEQPADDSAP